jgi:hypothetical protein
MVAVVSTAGVRADPRFDDGNAVATRFEKIRVSLNALDATGLLTVLSDGASLWTLVDGRVDGADAIRGSLARRFAGRAKNAYRSTPPRVLLERDWAWVYSAWEWDGDRGVQIARLSPSEGTWRVDRLDLDGKTAQVPDGDFDPRTPVARITEAIAMMERAATAFADGDFAALERLLRPDFAFYDGDGRLYEAPDSFIVAALTGAPDGVSKERMTLYLSWSTDLAVAFQEVGGKRVSLLLVRSGGGWQIAKASLSVPVETLTVSPRGLLATVWATLRQAR